MWGTRRRSAVGGLLSSGAARLRVLFAFPRADRAPCCGAGRAWQVSCEPGVESLRIKNVLHVAVHFAGEQSCFFAILDQALQRATRFRNLRRKLVHFEVVPVQQSDAPVRIEHVHTMRHVVERRGKTTILHLQTLVEDADDSEDRKTCTRNQRGLTRWQEGSKHAARKDYGR